MPSLVIIWCHPRGPCSIHQASRSMWLPLPPQPLSHSDVSGFGVRRSYQEANGLLCADRHPKFPSSRSPWHARRADRQSAPACRRNLASGRAAGSGLPLAYRAALKRAQMLVCGNLLNRP